MGLYTTLPNDLNEVDVIIVGGGTAGCVIASRLADASPDLSILVLESGPNNQNLPTVIHPALYRGNFTPDSNTIQIYMANVENQLAGRAAFVVAGDVLGGSSSVNGLMYTRAQLDDYEAWKTEGWSASEVLSSLRKFETFHGHDQNGNHGTSGPVSISRGTYHGDGLADNFLAVMGQIGYPELQDLQDLQSANAAARAYRYVSPQTGRRQDAATTYLHPLLEDGRHPNLHVVVESQVSRVIVDQNKQATGVEYRRNPKSLADGADSQIRTVKARKLTIISAGTHSTPLILERSGIGSSDILNRAGVPVVHELPGVGHDYQDHHMMVYTYKSSARPGDTLESTLDGTRNVKELLANDDSFLSWNGIEASAKIRPTESELEKLGPGFREAWDVDFKNSVNRPLALVACVNGILGTIPPSLTGQYFSLACYTTYPYSRGHIHITGPQIDDPPDFRTGYLSDPNDLDLQKQVWLYKTQRQAARKMAFYRGETHLAPSFSAGSSASLLTGTVSANPKVEIEYSSEDDEAIKQYVRENIGTTYHGLGTCKMAPIEQLGVVDKSLQVHGVQRLKVADMSIAPGNVSGNTMSTALMIGERAAEIFIRELGLGGR